MADWASRIVRFDPAVDPEVLIPHPMNPRLHGDRQRGAINKNLDEIGWLAPVVANDKTNRIIDGHMRHEEALAKNRTVPVLWVHLNDDDEERAAIMTMDPLALMATFDTQLLADLAVAVEVPEAIGEMLNQIANFDPLAELREPPPPVSLGAAEPPKLPDFPDTEVTSPTTRAVVLHVPAEDYQDVLDAFSERREEMGMENNVQVMMEMLGL